MIAPLEGEVIRFAMQLAHETDSHLAQLMEEHVATMVSSGSVDQAICQEAIYRLKEGKHVS